MTAGRWAGVAVLLVGAGLAVVAWPRSDARPLGGEALPAPASSASAATAPVPATGSVPPPLVPASSLVAPPAPPPPPPPAPSPGDGRSEGRLLSDLENLTERLKTTRQFSPEWWDTKYDQIELQADLGKTAVVRSLLENLRLLVPDLGGEEGRGRWEALAARVGLDTRR